MNNGCSRFFGCLSLSAVIHGAFFMFFGYQTGAPVLATHKRPLEISYQQTQGQKGSQYIPGSIAYQKTKLPQLDVPKTEKSVSSKAKSLPDFLKKELPDKESPALLVKKPAATNDDNVPRKSVSLPYIPGDTFRTPEYKSYYRLIRERIRKLAYYNYNKLEEGEIVVTFSLTQEGELINAKINDDRSNKNDYLRQTALRSIIEAAPYPRFPEKLRNNKKLSFNVAICFELK